MTSNINPPEQGFSQDILNSSIRMVNSAKQLVFMLLLLFYLDRFVFQRICRQKRRPSSEQMLNLSPCFFEELQFHCDSSLPSLAMFHIFQSNGGNSKTQHIQRVKKEMVSEDGKAKKRFKNKKDLNEITFF